MTAIKLACLCAMAATAIGIVAARVSERREPILAGVFGMSRPARPESAPAFARATSTEARASRGQMGGFGTSVVLVPDRNGQYHAEMDVEGRRIPVLVDTGATYVTLSAETAAELGIFPAPVDYKLAMTTANGMARAAPVEIPELHLGPIVARHVAAIVQQPGALAGPSLLGMSFLRGLSGFSVEEGRLILTQ